MSETPNYHKSIGSSGFGFEHLIQHPIQPDVPYREQMTIQGLQDYYNRQLKGVQRYLTFDQETREMVMYTAHRFEADLPYLEDRGIDTRKAKDVFEKLRKLP